MSVKSIIEKINSYDSEVEEYKRLGQTIVIPSIAYVNLALHYLDIGNVDLAQEKLLSSSLMKKTPEAFINLGMIQVREKNFEEAKKYFLKALYTDKNNAKALCFLGNVQTELGEYEDAEKSYKEALKIDVNNKDIILNHGITLLRQKKFKEAQEVFRKICTPTDLNINAMYFLGLIDIELDNFDEALTNFKFITKIVPDHADAHYYCAYLYYKKKDYKKTIKYATIAFETNPQKNETSMLLGESYMNLEDKENCYKAYENGAKYGESNYFYQISFGIALQHFRDIDLAKEKFEKVINLKPESNLGYAYLGTNCLERKDFDAAIDMFNKSLEIDKTDVTSVYNIGECYLQKGDYDNAISQFKQSLEMSAKIVKAYGKIAECYYLKNDCDNAESYFKKAVEYDSENITNYIIFARNYIKQNNYNMALKKLQNAIKLDENNIECLNLMFYVNYTLAKENSSDYNREKAKEVAEKIKSIAPEKFIYEEKDI